MEDSLESLTSWKPDGLGIPRCKPQIAAVLRPATHRLASPREASPRRAEQRFASLSGAPYRNAIARPQRSMGVFP